MLCKNTQPSKGMVTAKSDDIMTKTLNPKILKGDGERAGHL